MKRDPHASAAGSPEIDLLDQALALAGAKQRSTLPAVRPEIPLVAAVRRAHRERGADFYVEFDRGRSCPPERPSAIPSPPAQPARAASDAGHAPVAPTEPHARGGAPAHAEARTESVSLVDQTRLLLTHMERREEALIGLFERLSKQPQEKAPPRPEAAGERPRDGELAGRMDALERRVGKLDRILSHVVRAVPPSLKAGSPPDRRFLNEH